MRIGTRGSRLALWQANKTKMLLEDLGVEVEIIVIKTQGDKIQHLSFDKMEGKGFFTKEIEEKLLNNEIDLAVHSHKDLETEEPEGLKIVAVSSRANPSDILLIRNECIDPEKRFGLSEKAKVGTSSARRVSQLKFFRPDLELSELRGNVPTRIEKLREGKYDAIMLARAGVERLELDVTDLHLEILEPHEFVPAPAQGVLAWQARTNDQETISIVSQLNDSNVSERINVERGILKACEGGCQLPLGVYCTNDHEFKLWVSYAQDLNSPVNRFHLTNTNPDELISEALQIIKEEQKKKF
ncbi:MAG: hydroxymethylbilane synthase [Crocinitomicaceae bacterium]|nr:hydroxymethylbilane synthase [Crocinitomicaceae bacterium]